MDTIVPSGCAPVEWDDAFAGAPTMAADIAARGSLPARRPLSHQGLRGSWKVVAAEACGATRL
jgi:hypothetical protein